MKIYSATIRAEALKVKSRESYYARQKQLFILLVVLVSVLPLFLIGWASKQYYRQSWMQQTSVDLKGSAESRKELIDRFLNTQEDLLASLIDLYGLEELAQQEKLEQVHGAVNRGGVLVDLGVINASGDHLAYVGPYRRQLAGKNYREAAWFQETLRSGRYVSDVFTGYRGEPHFVVAVTDVSRNWILRATINSALFDALLASVEVGPDGDAFIINRKGELQTVSRDPNHAAPGGETAKAAIATDELNDFVADAGTTVHEHHHFLYVTTWVNNKGWLLILKTNINSSLAQFYRAWNLGLLSIVVASVFILVVTTLLVRSMMDRIELADKQRMLLNNRVREVDKMALVGRLAASVAHEVNNPLQVIGDQAGWILELLAEEDPAQLKNYDEYQSSVHKIKQHVTRASTITHRLLGFSRSREFKRVVQDINTLLQDTVSFLANEAKHHRITLRLNLQENLPAVMTDPSQLQQVFLNIVNNAMDAIGDDGAITIQTRARGERILVEFADSGPGLAAEHLQKIFDPFFTTKKADKGTGLGLSISKNIMQRLSGDIQVENGKQGGCLFTVTLPLSEGPKA
jgi:two-component system NtrC family sensor kinase